MVIIPSVQRSASGGLNSLRGWMGFLMALGAWLSTIIYYILLQARVGVWLLGWAASICRMGVWMKLPGNAPGPLQALPCAPAGAAAAARSPCPPHLHPPPTSPLQATRHFGFSPLTLQHCMNVASVLIFTALSLPIDGADWAANFVGWGSADWLSLVSLSTACYLGSGMCMQVRAGALGKAGQGCGWPAVGAELELAAMSGLAGLSALPAAATPLRGALTRASLGCPHHTCVCAMQVCVWKLGAPTAAMFFGLRLVFAVCLSTPILGSTVIQTGVQIAGVVVTAVAVTCYAGSQWWASRQAHQRAAAAHKAAAADGGDA